MTTPSCSLTLFELSLILNHGAYVSFVTSMALQPPYRDLYLLEPATMIGVIGSPTLSFLSMWLLTCSKPWHKIHPEYRESGLPLIQPPPALNNNSHLSNRLECETRQRTHVVFVNLLIFGWISGVIGAMSPCNDGNPQNPFTIHWALPPTPANHSAPIQYEGSTFYKYSIWTSMFQSIFNIYLNYRHVPSGSFEEWQYKKLAYSTRIASVLLSIINICAILSFTIYNCDNSKGTECPPLQSRHTFFTLSVLADFLIKILFALPVRYAVRDKAKLQLSRFINDNVDNDSTDGFNTEQQQDNLHPTGIELPQLMTVST